MHASLRVLHIWIFLKYSIGKVISEKCLISYLKLQWNWPLSSSWLNNDILISLSICCNIGIFLMSWNNIKLEIIALFVNFMFDK